VSREEVGPAVEHLAHCLLCGSSSFRRLSVPRGWTASHPFGDLIGQLGLVKCRPCGLVFVNPRPSVRRIEAFYCGDGDAYQGVPGSAWADADNEFLLEWIGRHLPPGTKKTLLDFGAGDGRFLLRALERGWKVQGFELGRQGLRRCRAAGLDVKDDLREFPSASFSLVTLHHVFEHLAEPVNAMNAIRRLLAPRGRLFLGVPNVDSLRARLASPVLSNAGYVEARYRAFPIHLVYYNARTLRGMMAKGGFAVEAMSTMGRGLDEYLIRPKRPDQGPLGPPPGRSGAAHPGRHLRRRLRDAFFSLGLGENLSALAVPIAVRPNSGQAIAE